MEFYSGYHFWGMHLVWWVFWIVLVVWIIFGYSGRPKKMPGEATPLEILQRKYVNNEISREEYEEKKAVLEGKEAEEKK